MLLDERPWYQPRTLGNAEALATDVLLMAHYSYTLLTVRLSHSDLVGFICNVYDKSSELLQSNSLFDNITIL